MGESNAIIIERLARTLHHCTIRYVKSHRKQPSSARAGSVADSRKTEKKAQNKWFKWQNLKTEDRRWSDESWCLVNKPTKPFSCICTAYEVTSDFEQEFEAREQPLLFSITDPQVFEFGGCQGYERSSFPFDRKYHQ